MYGMYPAERDCYQTINTNYKAVRYVCKHNKHLVSSDHVSQSLTWLLREYDTSFLKFFSSSLFSMNSLYRKEPCQSPDSAATSFAQSFAAVAAGRDRSSDKDIQSNSDSL